MRGCREMGRRRGLVECSHPHPAILPPHIRIAPYSSPPTRIGELSPQAGDSRKATAFAREVFAGVKRIDDVEDHSEGDSISVDNAHHELRGCELLH